MLCARANVASSAMALRNSASASSFLCSSQEVAGAVVRVCDQRVESDGFSVFGFGFTALPLVLERDAQIHMCVHEIGIYFTTTLARAVGIAGIEGQGCPTAAPSFGNCTQ